jgi:NADPH2:quinone reductase
MKAIRIHARGGPDVMVLEDVPKPVPGPGQVLIEVFAAGVNYADIGQRQGVYPNLRDLPATLGDEAAGLVVEIGPGVTGLAVGQRVVSLVAGGYAEYALAAAEDVLPLPDDLAYAAATAIPIQGITADLLLRNASRLRPGESVLVHVAAGGVGSLAIQLARRAGASFVIGSTRTAAKAETILALGADLVVNSADPAWPGQVRAATQGRGADVVLDPIGGEASQAGLACLRLLAGWWSTVGSEKSPRRSWRSS